MTLLLDFQLQACLQIWSPFAGKVPRGGASQCCVPPKEPGAHRLKMFALALLGWLWGCLPLETAEFWKPGGIWSCLWTFDFIEGISPIGFQSLRSPSHLWSFDSGGGKGGPGKEQSRGSPQQAPLGPVDPSRTDSSWEKEFGCAPSVLSKSHSLQIYILLRALFLSNISQTSFLMIFYTFYLPLSNHWQKCQSVFRQWYICLFLKLLGYGLTGIDTCYQAW